MHAMVVPTIFMSSPGTQSTSLQHFIGIRAPSYKGYMISVCYLQSKRGPKAHPRRVQDGITVWVDNGRHIPSAVHRFSSGRF